MLTPDSQNPNTVICPILLIICVCLLLFCLACVQLGPDPSDFGSCEEFTVLAINSEPKNISQWAPTKEKEEPVSQDLMH